MNTLIVIISVILIMVVAFVLIVAVPVLIGRLLFRWSAQRMKYIFSQSMSTIVTSVVVSLIISGLILLVGLVFKQEWAFSGGLLFVFTFWTAIKAVRQAIKNSKRL